MPRPDEPGPLKPEQLLKKLHSRGIADMDQLIRLAVSHLPIDVVKGQVEKIICGEDFCFIVEK